MRVLLTSNAYHLPPRGGSTRSNLIWLRHLAENGHVCKVVCPGDTADEVESGGIAIRRVPQLARQAGVLSEEIRVFQPDLVLVSSEDLSHSWRREAVCGVSCR